MTPERSSRPMRVERVLRLLPEVDVLAPLRSLLISSSRPLPAEEQHLTVGKRMVQSARLTELIPESISRVSAHLAALYDAAIDALEAEDRGDTAASVGAFVAASRLEMRAGRDAAARAWLQHALRLAEASRDRRPEISALYELGKLELSLGSRERAARLYQRSFALADVEGDSAHAAAACVALGNIALERGTPQGAHSWFVRGLQLAEDNPSLLGRLHLGMGAVAASRGEGDEARDALREARARLSDIGDAGGLATVAMAFGRLAAADGDFDSALAQFREALEFAQRGARDPRIELPVRLALCRFLLDADRLPDAEDEARRAEEQAVVHNLTSHLARLYVIMGAIRSKQRDDSGFVFFEKALELSRGSEPSPQIEAEAYLEYGRFRRVFDDPFEARAYFERAREIMQAESDPIGLACVDAELMATVP